MGRPLHMAGRRSRNFGRAWVPVAQPPDRAPNGALRQSMEREPWQPRGVGGELWRSPAFSRPVQPLRELKSTTPIPLALIPMILEVLLRLSWWSARVRRGLPHNVAAVVRHDRRILGRTIRLSQPGARWRANRGVRHCLQTHGALSIRRWAPCARQHSARATVQYVRQAGQNSANLFCERSGG